MHTMLKNADLYIFLKKSLRMHVNCLQYAWWYLKTTTYKDPNWFDVATTVIRQKATKGPLKRP